MFAQPRKKGAIAGEITAIEERNGKLDVVRIEPLAFREASRYRTELQPQVPQLLRKTANAIFELTLSVTAAVQKQQIDIGIGEKVAAAESAGRPQRKISRKSEI